MGCERAVTPAERAHTAHATAIATVTDFRNITISSRRHLLWASCYATKQVLRHPGEGRGASPGFRRSPE
jgi:hypothetical protein